MALKSQYRNPHNRFWNPSPIRKKPGHGITPPSDHQFDPNWWKGPKKHFNYDPKAFQAGFDALIEELKQSRE